jgi:hypothetical protein
MRPTLGEVRMAARLGRPVDSYVTICARAEIIRTPGRGETDPEARRLDAVADAQAIALVIADYAVALAEAIDTDVDVAFWSHALKAARRHLRHLLAALRPLWSLLDSAVADVDALDDVTAASYGPAPPPSLLDPTTSPHRPCAPPALFTRGHEWLPRVDAVGAPTERERVAILTG